MPKNPLLSTDNYVKPWNPSVLEKSLTTQAVGRAAEYAQEFRIEAERKEDSIKKIQMDSIKKSSTVNLKKTDTDTFNLRNHSNSFYAIIVLLIFSLFIITKFIVKRCR
jgi:2-phosphoglycerate kinase